MDAEFSFEDLDDAKDFDDFDGLDDFDEENDEMTAESRVAEIIDEMEFIDDNLDFFDESEIQRELTEMF